MLHAGNNNQEVPLEDTTEISLLGETLHTSMENNHEVVNYFDVVKVLSEVELPSPTPVLATLGTLTRESNVITMFHDGQSSGTKRNVNYIEGIEERKEVKGKQHDRQQSRHGVDNEINAKGKRRRNQISERIRVLQGLVPNCNKRSKASVIGDTIEYIKFHEMQVQMMKSMGVGTIPQGPYMSPTPRLLQVPNLDPQFETRTLINMQHGIPQFGYYVPVNKPIFPPFFSGFPPLMPPMEVGPELFPWRQSRPLLYPRPLQPLQFQSQSFQSMYSTPSCTMIPKPSQFQLTVVGQPSYHTPVISDQGTH